MTIQSSSIHWSLISVFFSVSCIATTSLWAWKPLGTMDHPESSVWIRDRRTSESTKGRDTGDLMDWLQCLSSREEWIDQRGPQERTRDVQVSEGDEYQGCTSIWTHSSINIYVSPVRKTRSHVNWGVRQILFTSQLTIIHIGMCETRRW